MKQAREFAGKVLNSYPDYAKATPGYTAAIIEAFAQYSVDVQEALAHIGTGLRSRCKFLPVVEDVVTLGNEIARDLSKAKDFEKRFAGRRVEYRPERPKQNVAQGFYPKLTLALGKDAELLTGLPHDAIQEAAKIQATKGNEAARRFLEAFKAERKAAA